MDTTWDCIVIGGGAAGLSAALVLGRARRTTLVVDAGHQSNLPAHGIGGLLGHDGRPPAELYALGRAELAAYPTVTVRDGEVTDARRADDRTFAVTLGDGTVERARRVLLATGMTYRHPDLDGLAERWGSSVFHCPFCHGWEVRGRPLGVLDRGPTAAQRATLLRSWSDDVTIYADGPSGLETAEVDRLRSAGIDVDERPVAGLEGPAPDLTEVAFADGSARACGGLLVPVTLEHRSPLAEQLGVGTSAGALSTASVDVDPMGRTDVAGVSAAGDLTPVMPSVANAVAAGSGAAAMIVHDLMDEDLRSAPAPA